MSEEYEDAMCDECGFEIPDCFLVDLGDELFCRACIFDAARRADYEVEYIDCNSLPGRR